MLLVTKCMNEPFLHEQLSLSLAHTHSCHYPIFKQYLKKHFIIFSSSLSKVKPEIMHIKQPLSEEVNLFFPTDFSFENIKTLVRQAFNLTRHLFIFQGKFITNTPNINHC